MFLYRVAPDSKIPSTWLTYSSASELPVGQLVQIPLRARSATGLIMEQVQGANFDVKSVGEVLPVVLPSLYMRFLHLFSFNTLNDYNNVISVVTGWVSKLSQKQIKQLDTEYQEKKKNFSELITETQNGKTKSIDYSISKEQWFRIRVIIRSLIKAKGSPVATQKNILILFPEKSMIENYIHLIEKEFNDQCSVSQFSGDGTASSRSTLVSVLTSHNSHPTHIICSTRAGCFLPFTHLEAIIVTDEANHMYIQEQNGVYYDTRDSSYLLSQVYSSELFFVSSLPSIRLYNFNSKKVFGDMMTNYQGIESQLPRIKIYKRENKDTFHKIFSGSILEDIGVRYLED